jgi:S1-C subfamily serine protease
VNGKAPRGFVEFNQLLVTDGKAGITLAVQRNGERRNVTVQLVPEKTFFNAELIQQKIGASLQELTPQLAEAMGLSSTEGFVVAGADRGSSAGGTLQPGCLVTSIDGRRPADLTEAAKILHGKKRGEKVRLGVVVHERRGNFIALRQGVVEVTVR